MSHLIIKGKMIIFHRGYENKFFVPMQYFEPFIFLIDSVVNIILLPTPMQSNLHSLYLRILIKKQMQKRLKLHNNAKS